jgi:hypothetical protein
MPHRSHRLLRVAGQLLLIGLASMSGVCGSYAPVHYALLLSFARPGQSRNGRLSWLEAKHAHQSRQCKSTKRLQQSGTACSESRHTPSSQASVSLNTCTVNLHLALHLQASFSHSAPPLGIYVVGRLSQRNSELTFFDSTAIFFAVVFPLFHNGALHRREGLHGQ